MVEISNLTFVTECNEIITNDTKSFISKVRINLSLRGQKLKYAPRNSVLESKKGKESERMEK